VPDDSRPAGLPREPFSCCASACRIVAVSHGVPDLRDCGREPHGTALRTRGGDRSTLAPSFSGNPSKWLVFSLAFLPRIVYNSTCLREWEFVRWSLQDGNGVEGTKRGAAPVVPHWGPASVCASHPATAQPPSPGSLRSPPSPACGRGKLRARSMGGIPSTRSCMYINPFVGVAPKPLCDNRLRRTRGT